MDLINNENLETQSEEEILGHYRMIDLKRQQSFHLSENVAINQINNLFYIEENAMIKFHFHPRYTGKDETEFYNKLTEIFKILEKHNRTYNISIYVENRESFKQNKVLEHTKNINLIIHTDCSEYTKEKYIEEEAKLDSLIEHIKYSNLSPYEKYLAVYNIVKQFKEYKENKQDPFASREIKEILKNDYMVCVGYANLLTVLLDKVNIPCIEIDVDLEDQNSSLLLPFKERPIILCGHARNLIKIDDDKYNIHGIYIADATFDNDMNIDLYNYASITYDKSKEEYLLEKIRIDDYLLDVHNFDEFIEKVNFCLKYEMYSRHISSTRKIPYNEKVVNAYNFICAHTMNLLYKLDKSKWTELADKYNELLSKKDEENISLKKIENIYCEFLTELGYYILELSNKEIDINTTLNAAKVVKKVINGYTDKEIDEWEHITKIIYQERERVAYPYIYNPNETRLNYLERKYKIKCHVKKITHSK